MSWHFWVTYVLASIKYQLETGYQSLEEALQKAQDYVRAWSDFVVESEPVVLDRRVVGLPSDYKDLEVGELSKSLQEHWKAIPSDLTKLRSLSEITPYLVAILVFVSFLWNIPIPFIDKVPILSEFLADDVRARDVAAWVPAIMLGVMVLCYGAQRRRSLQFAAVKDQIVVLVLKHGWRPANFEELRKNTFAVGKKAGLFKLLRGLERELSSPDPRIPLANEHGRLEDLIRFQQFSQVEEFENKLHGFVLMEKERDFAAYNQAFDPLLLLFRPYDPHFIAAFGNSIDAELTVFVRDGIEPRQQLRQLPGTDDLKWRRAQFLVLALSSTIILAAPAAWAMSLAALSPTTTALSAAATLCLLGIPLRWNYAVLIRKRGFPRGVRLMEAGRTLLRL